MTLDAPAPTEDPAPLQDDLVAMLASMREAERDLFARLEPAARTAPMSEADPWSPKDVLAHLAAWRAIEARRLLATAGRPEAAAADDPGPEMETDAANDLLQARHAGLGWEAVERMADESVALLVAAVRASSSEALCECGDLAAGIGANGINHAIGHLGDIARQAGAEDRFAAFTDEVEAVLRRGHLPPRDSGVMVYNVACHSALSGRLDDARRQLRTAFARRPDLLEFAPSDPDVAALGDELATLGGAAG